MIYLFAQIDEVSNAKGDTYPPQLTAFVVIGVVLAGLLLFVLWNLMWCLLGSVMQQRGQKTQ